MTHSPVLDLFAATHGFDATGIYCQLTGKRIGTTDADELDSLIDSVIGDGIEEAVDDIAMRLLASMRPSMRWNKMRQDSLKTLSEAVPAETLSFLINRLFAPLNSRKIGVDSLLGAFANRIKTYQLCESWGQDDGTNTLLYMLLELDAKWNLDTESPPFAAHEFLTADSHELRIGLMKPWYDRRVAAYDKKVKDDETQIKWSRSGNTLAKPAFLAIYLKTKPVSKTAENRIEKQAESDFMLGLLDQILVAHAPKNEATHITPHAPFVPIRVTPRKFGVK